ncbi:hypothetical protein [Nocardioides sp. Arc9.136]|uniref:hypothetical protein n=1 Tax=Nocardioides sp. Arc9.136 TaxID=2996826 RepID=UPI002665CADB|nr:hypothetical protein [Nocardioides sp. Arc9.136]WKN47121.1 hypothetical protein OSR43_13845 [Nocardioides sp. Arc9.136]
MSALKWHEGNLTAFDTETTGLDFDNDRFVTASIVHRIPGQRPRTISWLLDPGMDIPAEAAAVHGWTNDRLHARLAGAEAMRITAAGDQPMARDGALFEMAAQCATAMHIETPLVVHNAAFDLSMLEAELVRAGIDPLSSRPSGIRGVVDPLVIEKQYDPYRKQCYKKAPDGTACDQENRVHVCGGCRGGRTKCGGCGSTDRTLTSLCAHYRIVHTGAHDATADALACIRLLGRLAADWPEIARWKLPTLHRYQADWRREQQAGLASFFRKVGKSEEAASVEASQGWPVQTSVAQQLGSAGAA